MAIQKKVNFDDGITILPLVQWLDYVAGFDESVFVALPLIQRGSVWKPDQLLNLWDTLLRGMPLGSLMHSIMPAGIKVRKIGTNESIVTTESGAIGLIDGQQRTLAMLIAWLNVGKEMDRRIWVDFADKPSDEHLFRLYVTTKNQPFGFQKASPNSKLPLNERRKAWEAFEDKYDQKGEEFKPSQDFLFTNAEPYHGKSPLDLRILIELWRNHENNADTWGKQVESALLEQFGSEIISESVTSQIKKFATALHRLFELEIPLIKVNSDVFSPVTDKDDDISDPPLAVLFKRIGTGGTSLSDADYVYSVIKHHLPESYDLAETLHAKHNIAGLLSATDLVMTAVRLAAAEYKSDGKFLTDWESPTKQEFHRLIKHKDFLENGFLPLIQNNELEIAFSALTDLIQYREENNPLGLPLHAFPLLKRPLIQVLLRWIRCVQTGKPSDLNSELNKSRADVLRFIMYWLLCVTDSKKASSIVFEQLQNCDGIFSGEGVYRALLEKQVAIPIVAPETIKCIKEDVAFSKDLTKLRGWKRFLQTDESQKWVIALYQRWWGNGYVHPALLWLQRNYVATFEGSPVAGRDEDTPYDYDHICPSNHWGDGRSNNLGQFLAKEGGDSGGHWRVGNSIGNVRVWDSRKNRSDGDAAPNIKLELDSDTPERTTLLQQSAIDSSQIEQWKTCSGKEGEGRSWDEPRVEAFQDVVEKRAFTLYEHFYNELGFAEWTLREPNEIELST